nr:transposase [Winogradskyella sp.]
MLFLFSKVAVLELAFLSLRLILIFTISPDLLRFSLETFAVMPLDFNQKEFLEALPRDVAEFRFMGEHIFKRHNKTLLLYHLVFPLKYRKSVINEEIGEGLKQICIEISARYGFIL